jgi:proteasome lid subunit RPN8/RPN11
LIASESDIDSELWQAEGFATRIGYSRAVMQELGMAATEGFNRLSHGGVEIGGVLFGVRTPDSVKILAHRALKCEYALGPSFTLSANDTRSLEELLASAAQDPDLSGMQAVGWYHSHTRSDISLSEKDLDLYRRYFPEPWQIALVLRPHRFDPVRAGFFFREPDGSVHAKGTRHEFIIHPPRVKRTLQLQPDADSISSEPEDISLQATQPAQRARFGQAPAPRDAEPETNEVIASSETAARFVQSRWIWRAAIVALVLAVALYWINSLRPSPGFSLRALDVAGQLHIEWNRDARAIRNAAGGILEIEDGSRKLQNEVSKDELRAGSVTYMRSTGNVLIRLLVRGSGHEITETARFLGSPPQTAAERRVTERHDVLAASPPPPTTTKATAQEPSTSEPAPRVRPGSEAPTKPELVEIVSTASSNPGRQFVTPLPTPTPSRRRSVDIVPPAVPTTASNIAPTLPDLLPHLPAPELPKAELPKQIYRGPSEGKIIWAGKLARHGTIQIQGNHASQGYITGGLPGVPVRVQVFPAELTPGGLRIFTADSKAVANTEAPGAQNGWNRTSYVLSSGQADKLRLIESPMPQNAWNRVTVRAERGDHSIIVLRWELAGTEATR